MARAIPIYQRQNLAGGVQSAPNASSNVSAQSPVAAGLASLGQAAGNIGGVIVEQDVLAATEQRKKLDEQNKKLEGEAAVNATNVLSQGDVFWQENESSRMKSWKPGDADMRKGIDAEFDKWQTETEQKLTTDASKKYFRQHSAVMKARLQTSAFSFQEKSIRDLLNTQTDISDEADKVTVSNDPARLPDVLSRKLVAMNARPELTPAEKEKEGFKYRNSLYLAVEMRKLTDDPSGYYRERFGSLRSDGVPTAPVPATTAGFAGVMPRIFKTEGGYAASDGGNGAPVNFGINQGANPDVDVKNLTKDGAAKIYKDRYWDKIKGDTLPPELQGTAMDAAVNQGPTNAAKWIKDSGGDPVKFNALRRAHYDALLKEPANEKYRKTWLGRLAAYEGDVLSGLVATDVASGAPVDRSAIVPPVTFSGLNLDQQYTLRNLAETRVKQGNAVFKSQVDGVLRDAVAMHKDGLQDPQAIPSSTFERAYGADAPRFYAEYQKSRQMGVDISSFKSQSEAEIMASLDATRPVPGANYAADDARQGVRMQAVQQIMKQRNDDPAGYATKNSSSLSGQQAALAAPSLSADDRAKMTQKFVGENLAEQQRLGIASPLVLTPRQSDAIAMRAMKATKPEDSANLIAGLEQEYGGYFPRVFDQLVREHKISGDLLIIPNLPSQTAREAVSRLARVKESDLVQGIDPASQKAVKEAVVSTMTNFTRTIPLMTEPAAKTVNAYEATLRKLAYQFMQGGTKPSEAAEQARVMLLGQYVFDGHARFPRSVDSSRAMSGARRMLESDLVGIDVPRDTMGSRTTSEAVAEWQSTVHARPQFFTSQDDGGLELWATGNNGTRYRVTRGGVGVSYTWEQLMASNVEAQKAAASQGSGARLRVQANQEASRLRIEATRRQVEAEDGVR